MRSVRAPQANTRRPKLAPPPGACDTHLHVYGPPNSYLLAPERNYDPDPHSTLDDYLKVHRTLGLQRAVIVTGSANGTRNQVTMDALAIMNGSFKALALLNPFITDAELVRMKECGFTGFRIKSDGKGGLSFEDSRKMAERVRDLGWHVEFMSQSLAETVDAVPLLKRLKLPYVFDHVGHAGPNGHSDIKFKELLRVLTEEEYAWINLYSFYQRSQEGPPHYSDMLPIVGALVQARADRVIWGSNWPHAGISVPTPNDADLLDFLLAAVREEKDRQLILADNPAQLYGWPAP
jgi:predicted TIM-barrel fold metal-dependent hydrolase